MTPGSILSQSQAFSTESNRSQSSIHVNIMVPGVTGKFFLGHPVYKEIFVSYNFVIQSLRQTEKSTSYPPKDQIQEGHLMSGSGSIFNDFIQNDTRTLLPLKITYIVHILGHKVH